MSLNFDVGRVKNYEVLTTIIRPGHMGEQQWHPVTNALIWATMAVGMNEITEKNWIEFYNRLNAVEKVTGAYCNRPKVANRFDPKGFITPLEVYMHIGLHTNASSMTLAKFREHLYTLSCRDNSLFDAFEKVPEQYKELGLDTVEKDEWQEAWRFSDDTNGPFDTASNLKRIRITDPLGANDENIGSVAE